MKTPDYLSYDRYKKKKQSGPDRRLAIFVTTFFVTLLVFTLIAKSFSPDVDVSISEDSNTDAKETGLGVKRFIDDRLKSIQMEDNSPGASRQDTQKVGESYDDTSFNKYTQNTEEEKITLPTKKSKADRTFDSSDTTIDEDSGTYAPPTPPRPKSSDLYRPIDGTKMSKVIVGRYATLEQAKVAQEILMDSNINITPFIKNTGGAYTLQVGSYSSRAKAEEVASQLQRNNFPARIIQE